MPAVVTQRRRKDSARVPSHWQAGPTVVAAWVHAGSIPVTALHPQCYTELEDISASPEPQRYGELEDIDASRKSSHP